MLLLECVISLAVLISSASADCWETSSCQLDSWDVKGCAQYGRVESSRRPCNGGNYYTCCTSGGSAPAPSPGTGNLFLNVPNPVFLYYVFWKYSLWHPWWHPKWIRAKLLLFLMTFIDCWETSSCQLDSWQVKGCAQYGRVESSRRPCNGGYYYTCCTGIPSGPGNNGKNVIILQTFWLAETEDEFNIYRHRLSNRQNNSILGLLQGKHQFVIK